MLFLFLLNIKYNSSHSVVLLVIFLSVDRNYNEERTCSFLTVAQICPDWWLSNHSMFYLLIYNYTIRFHFLLVYLLQFTIIVAKDTIGPCDMCDNMYFESKTWRIKYKCPLTSDQYCVKHHSVKNISYSFSSNIW